MVQRERHEFIERHRAVLAHSFLDDRFQHAITMPHRFDSQQHNLRWATSFFFFAPGVRLAFIVTSIFNMKTIKLGQSDLTGTRIAYGCWRIAGTQEPAEVSEERGNNAAKAVMAAYEAGFTTFDLADVYCNGTVETIFGQVLKQVPEMRGKITIVSKGGIRAKGQPAANSAYRYDFSAEYIVQACEQSLERLGIETIDLYLLHRPDFLADWAEVGATFEKLHQAGKVRSFGVSNFTTQQVELLQANCPFPLVTNQIEFSLAKIDAISDGTLGQCQLNKMTPMAWSPLAAGRLASSGPIDMKSPDHAKRQKVRDTLDDIARARGTARSVIALAWLLRHPAGILPVIGTTNPERIAELAKADETELSRDEWYRLMEAANGQRLP